MRTFKNKHFQYGLAAKHVLAALCANYSILPHFASLVKKEIIAYMKQKHFSPPDGERFFKPAVEKYLNGYKGCKGEKKPLVDIFLEFYIKRLIDEFDHLYAIYKSKPLYTMQTKPQLYPNVAPKILEDFCSQQSKAFMSKLDSSSLVTLEKSILRLKLTLSARKKLLLELQRSLKSQPRFTLPMKPT